MPSFRGLPNWYTIAAYVGTLLLPVAVVAVVHDAAGYWVGVRGDHVTVFRGGLHNRWDVAWASTNRATSYPPVLREVLSGGIVVADLSDGRRLARDFPHSVADGVTETAAQRVAPLAAGACLTEDAPLATGRTRVVSCAQRHRVEVVSLYPVPFRHALDQDAFHLFAHAMCGRHAGTGIDQVEPARSTVDGVGLCAATTTAPWWLRGRVPGAVVETDEASLTMDALWLAFTSGDQFEWSADWAADDVRFDISVRLAPGSAGVSVYCKGDRFDVDPREPLRIVGNEAGTERVLATASFPYTPGQPLALRGGCLLRSGGPAVLDLELRHGGRTTRVTATHTADPLNSDGLGIASRDERVGQRLTFDRARFTLSNS